MDSHYRQLFLFFTVDYKFTPSLYTLAVDVLFPFLFGYFLKIKTRYIIELDDNTSITIFGVTYLVPSLSPKYILKYIY